MWKLASIPMTLSLPTSAAKTIQKLLNIVVLTNNIIWVSDACMHKIPLNNNCCVNLRVRNMKSQIERIQGSRDYVRSSLNKYTC